ncbi:MAG: DNA replication and repair protein RecF, partial [Victivallaceae bacterium]
MIRRFTLKNFRNYDRAVLDFAPARNLFIGGNGQGKSNLLEAIFYLAILRSFRTGKISELIQLGSRDFTLEAELVNGRNRDFFRSEYNSENRRMLYINEERIGKSSEFIGEITPIVFAPEDIRIINGPSSQRRSFLDMFISLEHGSYMRSLYFYTQALKQRNAVLRKHLPRTAAEVFGAVMAQYGIEIAQSRLVAIGELEQEMRRLFEKYPLIQREFKLNYQFDYQLDFESYNRALNDNYPRELKRGFTTIGPHLDEMSCLYDRKSARNFASAGQTRLLALFFKIASLNILYRRILES